MVVTSEKGFWFSAGVLLMLLLAFTTVRSGEQTQLDTIKAVPPVDMFNDKEIIGDSMKFCPTSPKLGPVPGQFIDIGFAVRKLSTEYVKGELDFFIMVKTNDRWFKIPGKIKGTLLSERKEMEIPTKVIDEIKKIRKGVDSYKEIPIHVKNQRGDTLRSVAVVFRFENRDSPWSDISNDSGLITLKFLPGDTSENLLYRPHDTVNSFFRIWTVKPTSEIRKDSTISLWTYDNIEIPVQLLYDEDEKPVLEEIGMRFWVDSPHQKEQPLWDTVCTPDDSGKINLIIPKEYVPAEEGKSNCVFCEPVSDGWYTARGYTTPGGLTWITIWDKVTSRSIKNRVWKVRLHKFP